MGSGNLRRPETQNSRRGTLNVRVSLLVFLALGSIACCVFADSDIADTVDLVLKAVQLKEEINLTGATLKEFIGEDPTLNGLREISLKTYMLPITSDDPAIKSFLETHETSEDWQTLLARSITNEHSKEVTDEGWQVIHHRIDKGKATLICGKEEDGVRDRLRIITVDHPEFSDMSLIGEIELSALVRLRSAIVQSMPSFEEFTVVTGGPGEEADRTIGELKYKVKEQRERVVTELYQTAESHKQLGEYEEALHLYERTIPQWQISSVNEWLQIQIYQDAAYCSERLGRFDQAEKHYRILLEKFGDKDEIARSASQSLARLKGWENTEKRIELLREAIEQGATTLLRGSLGLAYQQSDMYEDALEQYDIIIDNHQDYPYLSAVYLNAGICSEAMDMVDKAKEYYTEVAERFKGDHEHGVMAEKALIRMERGDDQPSIGLGLRFNRSANQKGVEIVTVFKNGPAKTAGIRPGDEIVAIDSKLTPDARSVIKIIGWEKNIGDEIMLRIRTNMQEMEVPVTLIKTPEKLER